MNLQKTPSVIKHPEPEPEANAEITDAPSSVISTACISEPSTSRRPAALKRPGSVIAIDDQPSTSKPRVLPDVPDAPVRNPVKRRVRICHVSAAQHKKKQQVVNSTQSSPHLIRIVRKNPLEVIEIGLRGNVVVSATQMIYPDEYMQRLSGSISNLLGLMQEMPQVQQGPVIDADDITSVKIEDVSPIVNADDVKTEDEEIPSPD